MKGLAPSAATRADLSGSSRESPADALGDLRVTVRASPPGTPPRTSYSSRSEHPVRFLGDFAGLSHGAPSISFGAPSLDRMSIAASGDGFTSSEDEGAVGLPPSGVVATAAPDPELTAMLARAAVSIGLEVNRPPSPEPSRLDDWFLRAGRGSQPRPAPVTFFPEVHEELTSSWMTPFTARSRSSASSVLTTLDGGVARGYAGILQVERAVAVHLCPRNAATWRNRPRLPSKACELTAALVAKGNPGSSVRMPQNAPPSVPSTPTPFRCTTTGTLIVLLEPLAQSLEAWLTLPSLSRWLTRTIRLGYAIQFARGPPKFNGVLETSVAVRNALVLREEIAVLLAKDAIEQVPPAEIRQGFYSPYFIVPKKGGGLRPILDLRVLNRALHKLPFKMLTHRRMIKCIQPQDWFAAIDLKDAYFHVSILPRQTVSTVCVRRSGMAVQGHTLRALPVSPCVHEGCRGRPYPVTGSGRQDPQLPRRLAYSSPIQRAVGRSQGLGAPAPQPVGASGQLGKEQALPCAENLFSRCGVRLGEYDGTPHGGTCPSSAELPEFLQRQECGTTETVGESKEDESLQASPCALLGPLYRPGWTSEGPL